LPEFERYYSRRHRPGHRLRPGQLTVALDAAGDQVILAEGAFAGTVTDPPGNIGRRVLASLMPARRLRTSPRAVSSTTPAARSTKSPTRPSPASQPSPRPWQRDSRPWPSGLGV